MYKEGKKEKIDNQRDNRDPDIFFQIDAFFTERRERERDFVQIVERIVEEFFSRFCLKNLFSIKLDRRIVIYI